MNPQDTFQISVVFQTFKEVNMNQSSSKWWPFCWGLRLLNDVHFNAVIMSTRASQITSLTIVYSTVYSGADQRIHQSSASLAFVWGIHRWTVNSPHKRPVTRKIFPFDDVIMFRKNGGTLEAWTYYMQYTLRIKHAARALLCLVVVW